MLGDSCCPMGSGLRTGFQSWLPWFRAPFYSCDNSDSPDHFHNSPRSAEVRNHVFSYKLFPVSRPWTAHVMFPRDWQSFQPLWPGVKRTMKKQLTSPRYLENSPEKPEQRQKGAPVSCGLAFHTKWPWMPPFGANVIDYDLRFIALLCDKINNLPVATTG